MNKYTKFIKNIIPIKYKDYSLVSSREKLVVYTIKYLRDNNIPLSWNYIVIASFKLFPEKFWFSDEFKTYPHSERLNRTLLHLRPKERNYAIGGAKVNYELTKLGEEIARKTEEFIKIGTLEGTKVKNKDIDDHKLDPYIEYENIQKSVAYKNFLVGSFDLMDIWDYFKITPFSQMKIIKNKLEQIKEIATQNNNGKTLTFIDLIIEKIIK